jgi:hypothetical protein
MMRKASRRSNDDDDEDEDNHHHRIKSHLIRPVPVRIETQRLYDSAAENGLNTAQVHAALEWQRQWTTYEPHSSDNCYQQQQQSSFLLMNDIMDHREQGARNPSPGKSVETDDDEEEYDHNDAPIIFVPKPKRSRDNYNNNHHNHEWIPEDDDDDADHVSDLSASPPGLDRSHSPPGFFAAPRADAPDVTAIVRPVAIRANDNNRLYAAGPPPAIIEDDDGNEVPERSLSPLTLYSTSQQGSTSHHYQHHHQQPGSNSHPPLCLGGMMVSCATTSLMTTTDSSSVHSETKLTIAREGLLNALASSDGDADDEDFQKCLSILEYSNALPQQQQQHSSSNKGMWLSLTKPTFFGCLGTNDEGDPLYTLARMSFDMFTPGDLICSLQGVFNEVTDVPDLARSDLVIPKSLVDEARDRRTSLQTYTYVVCCLAFVSSDPHTFGGMSHPIVRLFDLFSLSYLLQHYHCLYH